MTLSQQRCLHHPGREAVARCPECRQPFCRECVTEHDDRVLCAACLQQLLPAERTSPGRLWTAARLAQPFCGLLIAWLLFYWLGAGLLAIPSSFHDGTIWKAGLLEEP